MRERPTILYECEICGHASLDREEVARCEARGVPVVPPAGMVGYLFREEDENQGNFVQTYNWVVRVQVVATTARTHDCMCDVKVVPWPTTDEDLLHRSLLSLNGDTMGEVPLSTIHHTLAAAEMSLTPRSRYSVT